MRQTSPAVDAARRAGQLALLGGETYVHLATLSREIKPAPSITASTLLQWDAGPSPTVVHPPFSSGDKYPAQASASH